eukprot:m.239878 g.239878  ORF g.239878 m.239878 type:complete len:59 (+) comp14154_c0_seq1:1634-1810(+)
MFSKVDGILSCGSRHYKLSFSGTDSDGLWLCLLVYGLRGRIGTSSSISLFLNIRPFTS